MMDSLKINFHWLLIAISIVLYGSYQAIFASDRFISEANVVLESPQINAGELSFQAILGGGGKSTSDMLILRDYMLSVDMMEHIEDSLGFVEHYTSESIDFWSRLSTSELSIEEMHSYYLRFVNVELDEYSGVLRIKVSAFSPIIANRIARYLISEGESYMNLMGRRLAGEQVSFLEHQVARLGDNYQKTIEDLIRYQNKSGLLSAGHDIQSISTVISSLQSSVAVLEAKKKSLLNFQSEKSDDVVMLESEISSLKKQIEFERKKMTGETGAGLNVLSADYEKYELKVKFAQQSYSSALAALENTRIEAARKLKQISIIQKPTMPQYAEEPRRLHNIVVYIVVSVFLGLIFQMLSLIVRDHRD